MSGGSFLLKAKVKAAKNYKAKASQVLTVKVTVKDGKTLSTQSLRSRAAYTAGVGSIG